MNKGRIIFIGGLAVVALATAAGLAMARENRARLEAALADHAARRVEDHRVPAEAVAERAVAASPAARQPEEAGRLAAEIEALRRELAMRDTAATERVPARPVPVSLQVGPAAANPWPNAGRREPLDTFQTVQWAINEGDLDVLEGALAFDDAARAAARDFFDRLDAESKVEFRSPERLVAAAMAARSRSAIDQAGIIQATPTAEGQTSARLRIAGPNLKPREITLQFQSSAGGWRLQVPAKVVTGYRHLILGPVVDPATYRVVH